MKFRKLSRKEAGGARFGYAIEEGEDLGSIPSPKKRAELRRKRKKKKRK